MLGWLVSTMDSQGCIAVKMGYIVGYLGCIRETMGYNAGLLGYTMAIVGYIAVMMGYSSETLGYSSVTSVCIVGYLVSSLGSVG